MILDGKVSCDGALLVEGRHLFLYYSSAKNWISFSRRAASTM